MTWTTSYRSVAPLIDSAVPERRDAFALDMFGAEALDPPAAPAVHRERTRDLQEQPTEATDLPIKDDSDITAIVRGGERPVRRQHNAMTNDLREICRGRYRVVEGTDAECMFDALIENYDGAGRDMLIEVKSSIDRGVVRLAVGQLLDYRRGLPRRHATDLAVLLPSRPDRGCAAFLRDVGVACCWLDDGRVVRAAGAPVLV